MQLQVHKRHVLLLEVIIAIMLVALCVIPLLAPHAYILYRQQRFVKEVDLDHAVNLLYADVVLKLYRNEISWGSIINGNWLMVDQEMLNRAGYDKALSFKGTYRFTIGKQKPKKESPFKIYLLNLDFLFTQQDPKGVSKTLDYHYQIFLIRSLEMGEAEIQESDSEDPEEEEDNEIEGLLKI